jgi:hypothetical protein
LHKLLVVVVVSVIVVVVVSVAVTGTAAAAKNTEFRYDPEETIFFHTLPSLMQFGYIGYHLFKGN